MHLLKKPMLLQIGKAAASCALLFLLLRSVSWSDLGATLQQARPSWVLLAFAAAIGQTIVSAWRWQYLLRSLGIAAPSFPTLVYYYFVSGFFNNFAPANLAGDAVRVGSLFREGRDGVAVTGSVVLERLFNMAGLALLCVWALVAQPFPLIVRLGPVWMWAGALALVASMSISFWLWRYAPPRLAAMLSRMRSLLRLAWSHAPELGLAGILTVGLFYVMLMIMYCSLEAMAVHLALPVQLAVYAVAGLALTFPLTIQGVGVREGIYVGLLGLVGVEPERVLAALALNYVIVLSLSLFGGLLFWLGPRSIKPQIAK
jgi:uncharacterized membrane protein YbhN (UPF0104 family)